MVVQSLECMARIVCMMAVTAQSDWAGKGSKRVAEMVGDRAFQ
jgi:hypothetical protein